MARITVTALIDGGVHLKYGEIKAGREYTIDEEDFGAELFARPNGFESPHEKADRERREAEAKSQELETGDLPASSPEPTVSDSPAHDSGYSLSEDQSPVPCSKSPKGGK